MANAVDNRVVNAQFNNSQFEKNIQKSTKSLDSFKKALDMDKSARSISELDKAGRKLDMSHMAAGVDKLNERFSVLGIAGMTVISNLTNAAMQAGQQMLAAITAAPREGFAEYETGINATAVMWANLSGKVKEGFDTQGKAVVSSISGASKEAISEVQKLLGMDVTGAFDEATDAAVRKFQTEMKIAIDGSVGPETWGKLAEVSGEAASAGDELMNDINATLEELNEYADLTVYNFGQMTDAIGKFTAAGTGLKDSATTVKGLANVAAGAGVQNQQLAGSYIQVAQALQSGVFRAIDWMSLVNRNMANEELQNQLIQTANDMGIVVDRSVAFRDSLKDNWLTSEVFVKTMERAADPTNAWGERLTKAATEVRTFTQLVGTLQESLGSGWSQTWKIVIGDFNEAKQLFTSISDTLGGLIQASADARNATLEFWKANGGRDALVNALTGAMTSLNTIIGPISKAFKAIFPPITGATLVALTKGFAALINQFKIGEKTGQKIGRLFKGIFATVKLVGEGFAFLGRVIGQVVKFFLPGANSLFSGLLDTGAAWGDFMVGMLDSTKRAQVFEKALSKISNWLAIAGNAARTAGRWIKDTFQNLTGMELRLPTMDEFLNGIQNLWNLAKQAGTAIKNFFMGVGDSLKNIDWAGAGNNASEFVGKIKEFFSNIGTFIANAFKNLTWSDVVASFTTALVAGLAIGQLDIINSLKNMASSAKDIADSFADVLGGVTGALEGMQSKLKADALRSIAVSVALLAGALLLLSMGDMDKVGPAVAVITALFADLIGSMVVMDKMSKGIGSLKGLMASLIGMSVVITVLAGSVKKLAGLSVAELGAGLGGVTAVMAILIGSLATLKKVVSKGGVVDVTMLTALQVLVKVLRQLVGVFLPMAVVVGIMGRMDLATLGKGLGTVALLMGILIGSLKLLLMTISRGDIIDPASVGALALVTASLVSLTKVLIPMTAAVMLLGNMPIESLGKGLGAVAGMLILLVGALTLIQKLKLTTAVPAFTGLAAALVLMAGAMMMLSLLSWEAIGKGLVAVLGLLALLAAAAFVMTGAIPGAVAMGLLAVAMIGLAAAIVIFAAIPFDFLVQGLINLAVTFGVIGAAGVILGILSPLLIAAGVAMMLFGTSILFLGAGLVMISVALAAFTVVGFAAVPMLLLFGAAAVALGLVSPVLLALGVAMAVLGVAVIALGAGFAVLGLGLMVFNIAAPIAVLVMGAFLKSMVEMLPYMGDLALMGLALVAFGAGAAVAAVGVLALGIAFAAMAGAIALLGLAFNGLGKGLFVMALGVPGIAVLELLGKIAPPLLDGALGLAAFGLAAAIAGPGLQELGKGLVLLSMSGVGWIPMLTALAKVMPLLLDEAFGLAAFGIAAGLGGPGLSGLAFGLVALGMAGVRWVPVLKALPGQFKPLLDEAFGLAAFGIAAEIGGKGIGLLGPALSTLPRGMAGIPVLQKLEGVFKPLLDEAFGLGAFGLAAEIAGPGLKTLADGFVVLSGPVQPGIEVLKGLPGVFQPLLDESKGLKEFGKAAIAGADGLSPLADGLIKMGDVEQSGVDILKTLNEVFAPLLDDSKGLKKFGEAAIVGGEGLIPLANGLIQMSKIPAQDFDGVGVIKRFADVVPSMGEGRDKILKNFGNAALTASSGLTPLSTALQGFSGNKDGIDALFAFVNDLTVSSASADALVNLSAVIESTKDLVKAISDELAKGKDTIHKTTQNDLMQKGLIDGITKKKGAAQVEIKELCASLVSAVKGYYSSFNQAGVYVIDGLIDGMAAKQTAASTKARDIGAAVLKSLKDSLGEKSPSKPAHEMGDFFGLGLIEGMEPYADIAGRMAQRVGRSAVDGLNRSISNISAVIASEVDYSPTIRPILDLSEIQNGSRQLATLFGGNTVGLTSSIRQASVVSGTSREIQRDVLITPEKTQSAEGDTYEFTQNNYSPSALSSAQIYRNTSNQFSAFKLSRGVLARK